MKIPPGTPRSRSLTRLTMRVGWPHLGQLVLLVVSITFFRSAVLATFAIASPLVDLHFNFNIQNQLPGFGQRPLRVVRSCIFDL